MVVKKNAVTWRQPLVSEMAAIELTKTRQANFFAFLISAISGLALQFCSSFRTCLLGYLNLDFYLFLVNREALSASTALSLCVLCCLRNSTQPYRKDAAHEDS